MHHISSVGRWGFFYSFRTSSQASGEQSSETRHACLRLYHVVNSQHCIAVLLSIVASYRVSRDRQDTQAGSRLGIQADVSDREDHACYTQKKKKKNELLTDMTAARKSLLLTASG